MERLTMRDVGGRAFWISPQSPSGGYRLSGDADDLRRLDRLAAYEDTGLEPEEVSEYQRLCDSYVKAGLDAKFVQFCIDATQNGLSMDRIRELAQAEKDGRLVVLPPNDPLPLEELREMDGEPVWIVEYPDWGHWELSVDAEDYVQDRREEFYGMRHDDPDGKFGLHLMGWLAYRRKPEEGTT